MIVLVILQKLKIVPDKSIARQTKEKGDSLREYSVLKFSILTTQYARWQDCGVIGTYRVKCLTHIYKVLFILPISDGGR
jgi:protein tyrosine phosphatase